MKFLKTHNNVKLLCYFIITTFIFISSKTFAFEKGCFDDGYYLPGQINNQKYMQKENKKESEYNSLKNNIKLEIQNESDNLAICNANFLRLKNQLNVSFDDKVNLSRMNKKCNKIQQRLYYLKDQLKKIMVIENIHSKQLILIDDLK